jgi:ribosomal protein L11 methyltransferase
VAVVLDPGLSFGTGHHPTTAFCLRQVLRLRRPSAAQSVLDIGTGSGILALAAAKLGYGPVDGFDYDPEAVRVARGNAQSNGVRARIRFRRADVKHLPRNPRRRYSVVCANLMANLLVEARPRIVAALEPGGCLLLAGILDTEFAQVRTAYEASGLELVASRAENEWRSGAFVFAGSDRGQRNRRRK